MRKACWPTAATAVNPFFHAVKELLGRPMEIAKHNQFHRFAVIPKRWFVERSFAWLEKC